MKRGVNRLGQNKGLLSRFLNPQLDKWFYPESICQLWPPLWQLKNVTALLDMYGTECFEVTQILWDVNSYMKNQNLDHQNTLASAANAWLRHAFAAEANHRCPFPED